MPAVPELLLSLPSGSPESLNQPISQINKGSVNGYLVTAHCIAENFLPEPADLPGHDSNDIAYIQPIDISKRSYLPIPLLGLAKAYLKQKLFYRVYHHSGKEVTCPSLMANALRNKKEYAKVTTAHQLQQQIEERASEILDRLIPGSCLLIDFGNGEHTAMVIRSYQGEFEYFSYGATDEMWKKLKENFGWSEVQRKEGETVSYHEAKKKICKDIVEEYDYTSDKRNVLLTDVDVDKMSRRANKLLENQNYRAVGFNCAKFVAKVLKSGSWHIYGRTRNLRKIQMPEDTLRLARELQYKGCKSENSSARQLEREIDESHDFDSVRQIYNSKVIHAKSSLRFRLLSFLFHLIGLKTEKECRIHQLEKYIARHIIGSDEVKAELFRELDNERGSNDRILALLRLLRLDAESIERVVKLNDPKLLEFYLKHFNELDVNRIINDRQESMLLCAVRNQSNRIVRALLDRADTDKSVCDKDGNTLLILAAKKGNEEAVNMRLQVSPDISETNKFGKTAIDMAIKYNHHVVVNLLESRKQLADKLGVADYIQAESARLEPGRS